MYEPPMPAEKTGAIESVSVFVRGDAVSVVVRDASLCEDEAMRCAFQVAAELHGRRAALAAVTLNGRTVYRQSSPARQGIESSSSTLMFAC
jgi:hypothetical protein